MIHFDIEYSDLLAIGDELGATDKQVKLALSYSLRRTASKLRTLSSKGLRDKLELQRVGDLRERLKSIVVRANGYDGVRLWYGLNDMPVSWFKGRAKKTAAGAEFKGTEFKDGFIARSKFKNKRTVFKRVTEERLPVAEQLLPVEDKARIYIEDEVFVQLEDIFWPIFRRELNARVRYSIGGR